MKTIYISRSNTVPETLTQEVCTLIYSKIKNIVISMWTQGTTYNPIKLTTADTVVVILENYEAIVGKGVYSEIQRALNQQKQIVVAYKRKYDDTIQFYTFCSANILTYNISSAYASIIFNTNITKDFLDNHSPICITKKAYKTEKIIIDSNDVRITIARRSLSLATVKSKTRKITKKRKLILTPIIGKTR